MTYKIEISGKDARGNDNTASFHIHLDGVKPEKIVQHIGAAAAKSLDVMMNGDAAHGQWLRSVGL